MSAPIIPNVAEPTAGFDDLPEPPEQKVRAANDPLRPDWQFLRDCMRQSRPSLPEKATVPVELSEDEAAVELNRQLVAIWEKGLVPSMDAVIMKSMGGKKFNDTLKNYPAHSPQTIIQFIRSRLWNRNMAGEHTESKKGKKFSTNYPIQAWDSKRMGIVPYLKFYINGIIDRDWRQSVMGPTDKVPTTSFNVLSENGMGFDSEGNAYRADSRSNAQEDDEPTDYTEHDTEEMRSQRAAQRRTDAEEEGLMEREGLDDEKPASADIDEGEQQESSVSPERIIFEAKALASHAAKTRDGILAGANHPDYALLAAAMGPGNYPDEAELDQPAREAQLRLLARGVIEAHYEETSEERAEILEAIEDWNPSETSFANFFPEVIPHIAESLDDLAFDKARLQPEAALAAQQEVQLIFLFSYEEVSDELRRQAHGENLDQLKRPFGMSEADFEAAKETVAHWTRARAHAPEDLLKTKRPDYVALAVLAGEEPQEELAPAQLAKELKRLYAANFAAKTKKAAEFGSATGRLYNDNFEVLQEVHRRMNDWDPLTNGYAGEVMFSHVKDIRQEQKLLAAVKAQEITQAKLANAQPTIIPRQVAIPAPKTHQPELFDLGEEEKPVAVAAPLPLNQNPQLQPQANHEPSGSA